MLLIILKIVNDKYYLIDCWEIVDVGVLLDVSSSMKGPALNIAKMFLNNLVRALNISRYGAHVGLITFTHKATLKFTFKNSLNKGDFADGFTNVINVSLRAFENINNKHVARMST